MIKQMLKLLSRMGWCYCLLAAVVLIGNAILYVAERDPQYIALMLMIIIPIALIAAECRERR